MSETLLAMAEMAFKFASDILINRHDSLMPMFVVHRETPEPKTDIIGCPFQNDEEKKVMVFNVALEIAEKGADAWSFVTESWFAHREKGEPLGPRPSDDPHRREGLMCLVSDGKTTEMHAWEIIRDADGNCTELVPQEKHGGFSSWITDTLNQAKKLHDDFPDQTAEAIQMINKIVERRKK